MGHGLFRQPFHRQHELSSGAHEQPSTAKRLAPTISTSIRVTHQGDRPADPVWFPATVSDTTGRLQRTGLATKCGQCL